MPNEPQTVHIDDWVVKLRLPESQGPHPLLLLLHGWTGNEDVMWIFASRLPDDCIIAALRGPYPAPMGGYAWHPHRTQVGPDLDDFRPAVDAVMDLIPKLVETVEKMGAKVAAPHAETASLAGDGVSAPEGQSGANTAVSLVGFSQGAALAYSLALLHPQRVDRLAGLAGFLPNNAEAVIEGRPLEGKQIYITHGTRDQIVGVELARRSVALLEQAGAQVTYCEEDVGHKLSLPCFRGLEKYYKG